ncbi:DinB family protein [Ramlibacter sp.]|uniref:DinB family protein n=1 Tax=Ramlibacter sp. TaxID=1917967 RepID=UPI003D12363E
MTAPVQLGIGTEARLLLSYSAWANGLLYEALAQRPGSELAEPRPGRPQGLLGVMGHVFVIGEIWKSHLTARPHGFRSKQLESAVPLEQLRRLQAELDAWYVEFAAGRDEAALGREIEFKSIDGSSGALRARDMLLHVANHATYHRGAVAAMLYDGGVRPPTMDLPVFLHAERARTELLPPRSATP